ncbi:MAG: hypothetical protein ACE5JH_08990 [Acidobacteriota bacterium]
MNAYLGEGLRLLRAGDWVEAIRSLAWARDTEPEEAEVYLALIDAYERGADAENEPDLLQQAFNVCRDLRDRRLPMSEGQRRAFYDAFVRVRGKIVAARARGWTPPPPKEKVRALSPKARRA